MKEPLIDVPVLLVFFTRHEQFKKVFEQVKIARPSELFLYQDGPREGHPDDVDNILKCREIAENIDWNCKVHRLYQKKNVGVDPSGYLADTWAFSIADRCIVLEDDVVPSQSFFGFCRDMLDKYENDRRIMLISGFNVEEITPDVSYDYFFSRTTFTWGWASWARVVRQWDCNYSFLSDNKQVVYMRSYIRKHHLVWNMMSVFKTHLSSGKEHFETILITNQYLNDGLTVVPKVNLINNIGVATDSAHYSSDINMIPKGFRRIFTMKRYEIDLQNLKHPDVIEDFRQYKNRSYRIYAWNHPFIKIYRQIEIIFYFLNKGDTAGGIDYVKGKVPKLLG